MVYEDLALVRGLRFGVIAAKPAARLFCAFFSIILGAIACQGIDGIDGIDDIDATGGGAGHMPTAGGTDGAGGQPLPEPQPMTVVTWNVENFINNKLDDDAKFEQTDNKWPAHRARVGVVLRTIDADVVVLQEVEHAGVLDELNKTDLGERYSVIHVLDGNDPRGIEVGIMSKWPVTQAVTHKSDRFTKTGTPSPQYRYARNCLEIHLQVNGRHVVLLGVHYRSKSNDDPNKRLAEAQRTRAIADEITAGDPSAGVVILGDFNDVPGSEAFEWTLGAEPNRYKSVADLVPETERWSYKFGTQLELIDQQIANSIMSATIETGAVRIVHTAAVSAASDHSPLIATYMVR